jgi:hypothetical protein
MHRSLPGCGSCPYHRLEEDRCGLCVDSRMDCRMRLNEDFKSTHNWAAWALAYELGDSAVGCCRIIETLPALLQAPVANHGVVHSSSLFINCIGYTMLSSIEAKKAWCRVSAVFSRREWTDEPPLQQVEVFILQIKFPSLNLPGQCDICCK